MSFSILNTKKEAVTLHRLDEIAAELWNVPLKEKEYAVPYKREAFPKGFEGEMMYAMLLNWYDVVGWAIHFTKKDSWDGSLEYLELGKDSPYVQLIEHFKELGYTPMYVEDK